MGRVRKPPTSEQRLARREAMARYRARHPDRVKAYRIAGKDKATAWRKANQKLINAKARAKYVWKPKRPPFNERVWRAAWRENNKVWYLARAAYHAAARRVQVRKATPRWANTFFIREIYHLAQLRTKYLGVAHDVDHIVPLCAKTVSGLHVHYNLQVIPTTENRKKNNSFDGERNSLTPPRRESCV